MKTIETYLPIFPGFYGSIFEYEDEEQDIENYNEENNTDLNYNDFEFDYTEYHNRVSKKCCEIIERELKYNFPSIIIKFQKLRSPKEYNFFNDSVDVKIEISEKDFDNLILFLGVNFTNEFQEYLKENYSSRSGFTSFYSTDINIWFDEYLKTDKINHCFGSMLNFFLLNEGFTDYDLHSHLDGETYINYEIKK